MVYQKLGTWKIRKGGQDTKQPNPQIVQVTFPALLQLFRTAAILGTNSVTWKKDIGTSPCHRDVRMDTPKFVWSSKHSNPPKKALYWHKSISIFVAPHTQKNAIWRTNTSALSLERSLIHRYRSSQTSIMFGGFRHQSWKKKKQTPKQTSQFLFLSLQINMKPMDPTVSSNFLPIIPEKWKGSVLQEKGIWISQYSGKKKGARILSIKAQIHRQRLSS